jgi:hypothetical protein
MPAYEKSVFINCPYDGAFEPLFHAIVLTVAALGFTPRSAGETEGEADPRMVRIARGLLGSKYSIHDLSRFQGEGAENLARFNMPLELGMALGIRYLGQVEGRTSKATHNWLVLVPENFVHQKFISDLAGYDASDHDQTPRKVIQRVAKWLRSQPDFKSPRPEAKAILDAFPQFEKLLEVVKERSLGTLTWLDVATTAQAVVSGIPA